MPQKRRRHFLLYCQDCCSVFERRSDNIKRCTNLCVKCSNKRSAKDRITHGHNNTNSRLHVTWSNMKRRCLNPVGKEKILYAGIELCEEWYSFEPFMVWALANGYDSMKTIDRENCKLGYNSSNCRFVDYSTQSANRRKQANNTTGYIGVYMNKFSYTARVCWERKAYNLGSFKTGELAAIERDKFVVENNLPHTLNFPHND